jgi:opacity protein-like surface antigen
MKKTLILTAAIALAGLSNVALAADGAAGFIRADIGQSNLDGDGLDENYTSTSFGGGYWFNRNFAIEGRIGVLANEEVADDIDVDLVHLDIGAVAKKNFGANGNGFYINGRAGVSRLTLQVREDDFDVIDDESSIKPYVGVGIGYDFNDNWGLGLGYDFRQADFDGGLDLDVETISVGGEWRF